MDWVTVARKGAKKASDEHARQQELDRQVADSLLDVRNGGQVVLVVDSAAIIKGLQLPPCELFTVPEVLDEIRDKKARHLLDTMPFELKMREPAPEHVTAGVFVKIVICSVLLLLLMLLLLLLLLSFCWLLNAWHV